MKNKNNIKEKIDHSSTLNTIINCSKCQGTGWISETKTKPCPCVGRYVMGNGNIYGATRCTRCNGKRVITYTERTRCKHNMS